MRQKISSSAIGIYIALLLASNCYAENCIPVVLPRGTTDIRVPRNLELVRLNDRDTMTPSGYWLYHNGENLALSGPGKFCLQQDIVRHVSKLARLIGEPGGYGPLVTLSNSGIILDLNRHYVRSNRAGIAIKGHVGGHIDENQIKEMVFRNGTIDVAGRGIELIGWQYTGSPPNYRPGPLQINTAINWYGPNFQQFGDSNILLENLTIKSGGLAAYLVGRNNIIRHCRIEVEGHEAVALFGANNQLIDNEIIIKRSRHAPPKPDQPLARLNIGSYYEEYAAIWIRDAPGLIIRANKITIEGLIPAREAIILVNSPNVVIENNEVTGAGKLYTALDKQSSAHTYNNRKRVGKWPEN